MFSDYFNHDNKRSATVSYYFMRENSIDILDLIPIKFCKNL